MSDRHVGVVGAGYVGLTSGAGFYHLGHRVTLVDIDAHRVEALRSGELPFLEPELERLVTQGVASERLHITTDRTALALCDTVFVCVPTPMGEDGAADLSSVDAVVTELAALLAPGSIVVTKSTVPVGTTIRIGERLEPHGITVVSNPEFLRESHAVHDFLNPDRIVVGASDADAGQRVVDLYAGVEAPVLRMDPASAELAKYASNAFLALKLSYANTLADLCDHFAADIRDVGRAMGADHRIGASFLNPGPGWGGSCLPKDTHALLATAERGGVSFPLLRAALETNAAQAHRVVAKARQAAGIEAGGSLEGVRIGLLGLAFKADTCDVRDSPALTVAAALSEEGAVLTAYDPGVSPASPTIPGVQVVDDPYLVAKDAAVLVLLTEWSDFRTLDWDLVGTLAQRKAIVDTRNLLDPAVLRDSGFQLVSNGLGDGEAQRCG